MVSLGPYYKQEVVQMNTVWLHSFSYGVFSYFHHLVTTMSPTNSSVTLYIFTKNVNCSTASLKMSSPTCQSLMWITYFSRFHLNNRRWHRKKSSETIRRTIKKITSGWASPGRNGCQWAMNVFFLSTYQKHLSCFYALKIGRSALTKRSRKRSNC